MRGGNHASRPPSLERKPAARSHRFVARCIPIVAAVFVAGAIVLVAVSERRERAVARAAARLAAELVPWRLAIGDVDRVVANVRASAATRGPRAARDLPPLDGDGALAQLLDAEAGLTALRAQWTDAGDDPLRALDELSRLEHAGIRLDLGITLIIAAAALAALLVTARREHRAREREDALVSRLAERNADLDAFAGRLAHDLRNPLSPILMGVQRIERADVPPEVRELASGVERSARRLREMIEVVLEFARGSAPAAEAQPCDVGPIIDEAIGIFGERARATDARFEVTLERGLAVRCEAALLSSVMQNLIDNALKYGCAGATRVVHVRARRSDAQVCIEVEDEGKGVPDEQAERVFEASFQGRRGSDGLGLGLATVKRLLGGRAGSIELARGVRGGALFRVRLPAVENLAEQNLRS